MKFDIADELAKGDHTFEIPKLFTSNAEFEKLRNYKIPQNSHAIMWFLLFSGVLFSLSALFFLTSFLKYRNSSKFSKHKILLSSLCAIMIYYIYVLAKNVNIFYFPAPYKDYKFSMLNIAAYIPFLALLLVIPLIIVNKNIFKENSWSSLSKWLFTINNFTFVTLIILFGYWGLYNVIS